MVSPLPTSTVRCPVCDGSSVTLSAPLNVAIPISVFLNGDLYNLIFVDALSLEDYRCSGKVQIGYSNKQVGQVVIMQTYYNGHFILR
jgi:hypothetical protein